MTIYIKDLIDALHDSNIVWLIVPIFFIGVITDKYQEEYETPVGNAITNGALILFSAFSWIQHISNRDPLPLDITLAQYLLSIFMIFYGLAIIGSGFRKAKFAKTYGRIRVVTFMLIFFTLIIHIPTLFNFYSILFFVMSFPLYYAAITGLIHILPEASKQDENTRSE